ncbi:MAG: hypothetical protein ACLP59_17540 [Bryobacteraceae bacterium]
MLVSEKQQKANRRNARKSTGPITPEGQEAVKFNALKYGLRTRSLFLPCEDPAEFDQLWEDLMSDWHPVNSTEKYFVEQMVTAHWLLARLSHGEQRVFTEEKLNLVTQLDLLDRFSKQRARLEHSFIQAVNELQRLQKERKSSEAKSQSRKQPARAAYPVPPPAEPSSVVCASADTR